jgi:hypothetical protein
MEKVQCVEEQKQSEIDEAVRDKAIFELEAKIALLRQQKAIQQSRFDEERDKYFEGYNGGDENMKLQVMSQEYKLKNQTKELKELED